LASVALFLIISLVTLAGRWQNGSTDLYLSSDAANIASFSATLDQPEAFTGDGVLDDPRIFDFYLAAHIPLIRWMQTLVGDYGVAFVVLLAPHAFLHLLGFYVLGRVLFGSRPWALALALITFSPVSLNMGTFWGMYADAIPRVSFQVLLPFVLAAAVHLRGRPAFWPAIMGCMGLLTYVHPVSAPVWGLVLWFGFIVLAPSTWSRQRRFIQACLTGGAFAMVIGPSLVHYTRTFAIDNSAGYDLVRNALLFRLLPGMLDPPKAFLDFILTIPEIITIGAAAIVFTWYLDPASRPKQRMLHAWMAALLVVSVLLPSIEHAVARANRSMHLEIDLIRNLRYIIPLLLTFWMWTFSAWNRKDRGFSRPSAVGLIILATWIGQHPPAQVETAIRNFAAGRLTQENPMHAAFRRAVAALRASTLSGEQVLATFAPVHIRYGARRPVVYTYKDGGILAYADHKRLIAWHETAQHVRQVETNQRELARKGEWDTLFNSYAALGRKLDARILFLRIPDEAVIEEDEMLFRGGGFVIARIPPSS
jgi:hypothetical protein